MHKGPPLSKLHLPLTLSSLPFSLGGLPQLPLSLSPNKLPRGFVVLRCSFLATGPQLHPHLGVLANSRCSKVNNQQKPSQKGSQLLRPARVTRKFRMWIWEDDTFWNTTVCNYFHVPLPMNPTENSDLGTVIRPSFTWKYYYRLLYKYVISNKVELRSGAPCHSYIITKGNSHIHWKYSLTLALSCFQRDLLSVSSLWLICC